MSLSNSNIFLVGLSVEGRLSVGKAQRRWQVPYDCRIIDIGASVECLGEGEKATKIQLRVGEENLLLSSNPLRLPTDSDIRVDDDSFLLTTNMLREGDILEIDIEEVPEIKPSVDLKVYLALKTIPVGEAVKEECEYV